MTRSAKKPRHIHAGFQAWAFMLLAVLFLTLMFFSYDLRAG